jgi:hypothetical protein
MVRPIIYGNFNINHRVSGNNAILHGSFDTSLNRVDEFLRNYAAHDFVVKFKALACFHRFKTEPAVAVLTMTAGLTNEFTFRFNRLADGFTVSNLRFAYGAVHVEFTSHTIDDDIQVEFAHTGNNGLVGFRIRVYLECRIFFCQSLEGVAHLFLVSFGLRFNSNRDNGIREFHFFKDNRMVRVTECIAGGNILEAYSCSNIAGVSYIDFLSVVGVHQEDTANTFLLVLRGVQDIGALVHFAGVNPEISQFTYEGICHDLECQGCQRSAVGYRAFFFFAVQGCALDRRNIQRRWQVVNDSIQKHLDTFVLVCRAAEYGEQLACQYLFTDGSFDFVDGNFFPFQIFFSQCVIAVASGFDDLFTVFFDHVFHIIGNRFLMILFAVVAVVNFSFSFQQVDDTFEGILLADWELHRDSFGMQTGVDGLYSMQEICANCIHLVDECNTGNMVVVCLSPNGFRLGLNAIFCTEYGNGAIQYAQGTFNFYCEVYMPWGINDVDTIAFPVAGGSSRCNGNTAFLFLSHPVHGSCAIMNFTDLVVYTGIIQDTFRGCCLTCINVCHDADVSCFFKRKFSAHDFFSLLKLPAVMSKSLVGFSHFMSIFFLLYCCARIVVSVHQFTCKTFFHSTFAALAGIVDHPADTQSQTAVCSDFYRHLIVGAAYTTGTNFNDRHNIIESLFENFDWFFIQLAVADIKCAIDDRFCDALLAVQHNLVDETGYCLISIHGIRQHVTSRNSTFSRHC